MTTQIHDQLFYVPTHSVEISLGTFSLPFFIYEATNLTAIFRAQRDQAETLLQGTGLEPAFVMGSWALVALTFFQYRASSAGEYNEVGLMLPAVRQGQGRLLRSLVDLAHHLEDREMGMYVVDLPVTTELACVSGRELWGYPKFRTQIPFNLQGRQFRGDRQIHHVHAHFPVFEVMCQIHQGAQKPALALAHRWQHQTDFVVHARTAVAVLEEGQHHQGPRTHDKGRLQTGAL